MDAADHPAGHCQKILRHRVLILGSSLAKFMRELGVYSSGGGNVHTNSPRCGPNAGLGVGALVALAMSLTNIWVAVSVALLVGWFAGAEGLRGR